GRGGSGTDGAGGPVDPVGAVGVALAGEVVALHGAGEALAPAHRRDVDSVAGVQQVGGQLLAHLVGGGVGQTQFHQLHARVDRGLGEVPGLGLVELAGVTAAVGDLEGAVAVVVGRLDLHDAKGRDTQDGDGNDVVVVV